MEMDLPVFGRALRAAFRGHYNPGADTRDCGGLHGVACGLQVRQVAQV